MGRDASVPSNFFKSSSVNCSSFGGGSASGTANAFFSPVPSVDVPADASADVVFGSGSVMGEAGGGGLTGLNTYALRTNAMSSAGRVVHSEPEKFSRVKAMVLGGRLIAIIRAGSECRWGGAGGRSSSRVSTRQLRAGPKTSQHSPVLWSHSHGVDNIGV